MSDSSVVEINDESIKALTFAVNSLKIILDKCVKTGNIFNNIDEAVYAHVHLKNIDSAIFHMKDTYEKKKK